MEHVKKFNPLKSFVYFYIKETRRFLAVWGQTVMGPLVTTALFLLIFGLSLSRSSSIVSANSNYTYVDFLVPGLIMMAILQNAFANSSSSIFMAKINGNIADVIMAPISSFAVVAAYVLSSVTRGIFIALFLMIGIYLTVGFKVYNIWLMVYFIISAATFLGSLGVIAGIISSKGDHLGNFTTLIIMPLSFLSGTFYSTRNLPAIFQSITEYNPIFYFIDGFRYSFIGVSDFNITTEILATLVLNILIVTCTTLLWKSGYKIKN